MQTTEHKRGDSIDDWTGEYIINDVPQSLTGYTVTCQLRKRSNDALVGSLTVTLSNQTTNPGEYTLSATAAATAAWPITELVTDIKYVVGGVVAHTETFGITVVKSVTA